MEHDDNESGSVDTRELSRPTTPKWWRPNYPPKTYYWEEIRRKREQGGYPWTYLDRDPDDMGDNLYEPVNPRPYYGSGNIKNDPDSSSLDDRLIEIPPEIDIITSEGLDGLDQVDAHDFGFDGDKEWHHYPEEDMDAHVPKTFTAGIRNKELPKYGETSSERPLMTKNVTGTEAGDQEVPNVSSPEGAATKSNALMQLKQKAGQVKKQLSKISLPVRPKFNNWSGITLSKKKRKLDDDAAVPDDDDEVVVQETQGAEKFKERSDNLPKSKPPVPPPPKLPAPASLVTQTEVKSDRFKVEEVKLGRSEDPSLVMVEKTIPATESSIERTLQSDSMENKNVIDAEAAAELIREAKAKAEERKLKGKSQEDLKRQKQEEKLAKEKVQEELKKQKAEEKAAKDKAKEEKKKAEAEDKLLRKKQEEELKKARLEEESKRAQEQEEIKRKKLEEEAKLKMEQEKQRTELGNIPTSQEMEIEKPSTSAKAKLEAEKKIAKENEEIQRQQAIKAEASKKQTVGQGLQESLESEITQHAEETTQPSKEKKSKRAEAFKTRLANIDFTKRFKRSKTPPGRMDEPPKLKFTRTDDEVENKLAAQYAKEILRRDAEMENEKEMERQQQKLHEPIIYITQASVETADSESHSAGLSRRDPLHYENLPDHEAQQPEDEAPKQKLGERVKETSKNIGQKMKVIGHDLKQFGGKVNVKCKETIKEIKATQEAAKKRSRESREAKEASEAEPQDKPVKTPRTSFRFKKRPLNDEESFKEETEPAVVTVHRKQQTPSQTTSGFDEYFDQSKEKPPRRAQKQEGKIKRNEVLGRADRDWESPLDLVQSRDASEEPFSGRYSPPGSSTASSRRQGVLEEIDSDEFFLRERGISEGEDEEEVNRLLMHELRQTFRPMNNSLKGFDAPSPPSRPSRSPRKPPRKSGRSDDVKESNFQTFPPERPKRKQTPGYISAYLNQNKKQDDEDEFGKSQEDEDEFMALESDEDDDEGIRRVKLELRKIDQDLEDEQVRYEPVLTESPLRPRRAKKDKSKSKLNEKSEAMTTAPQIFYYNTIGANEWKKQAKGIVPDEEDKKRSPAQNEGKPPVAPKRVRRKSEGGKSGKSEGGKSTKSETQFSDIDNSAVGLTDGGSSGNQDDMGSLSVQVDQSEDSTTIAVLDINIDDSIEYVDYDEDDGVSGYAKVSSKMKNNEEELPKTVPRRKHRDKSKKSHSLKRRSQEGGNVKNESGSTVSSPVFCSLPRFTPRTFHIVPPTRPHRNYSSLKPKRPPRHSRIPNSHQPGSLGERITSHQPPTTIPGSPSFSGRDSRGQAAFDERDRASSGTPIGAIQGRPLPPPPRPQRSPVPMNDLDHTNIERMIGIRHYANFVEDEDNRIPVVEELCIAKNIPLLGSKDDMNQDTVASEANAGVQTDPVQGEDEFDLNTIGSFEDEDYGSDKQRDSVRHTTTDGPPQVGQTTRVLTQPDRPVSPRQQQIFPSANVPVPTSTQVIFPSRLHLDELEVDFLRVNELTAQSITMDHLHSPQLYVDSMTSSGPLIVPLIQSSNLAVDQVNTERVSANDFSGTSIPPASFYEHATPPSVESVRPLGTTNINLSSQPPKTTTSTGTLNSQVETTGRRRSTDDVIQLTARLGRALFRIVMRGLDGLTDYLDASTSNDPECQSQQRSQIQILVCLLLVLVIGIFLMSGTTSSQPRWEFFLPPPDL